MTTPNPTPPDRMLDTGDPGDETLKRYRYQAAYIALVSIDLLAESSELEELFCEHFEDMLVKRKDGKYVGCQIKTRALGLDPFKASDEEIVNALKRFIKLEIDFPGWFTRYTIVTNCGFWRVRKNSSNLEYLLDLVRSEPSHAAIVNWIKTMASRANCTATLAMTAISKIQVTSGPGLGDIENRLVAILSMVPRLRNGRYPDLTEAADRLTARMLQASSLTHDAPVKDYLTLMANPAQMLADAVIEGKRITRHIVDDILAAATTEEGLLRSWKSVPLSKLPRGVRKLGLKMGAGGIPVVDIDLAKDHKYSAETLLDQWLYRYGEDEATKRYEHLRTVVLTECSEAHAVYRGRTGLYGEVMLTAVKSKLRTAYQEERESLFKSRYHHLLGVAGILTEECTQWWSEEFDIPEEDE